MGKKSKDSFVRAVNKCFTRRRENREYKLPTAYIYSVADVLHRQNPTKEIYVNTLTEFASVIYERAWVRRGEDFSWWKKKKEKNLNDEFNLWVTYLDDLVACKDGSVTTFDAWQKEQQRKRSNTNQTSK